MRNYTFGTLLAVFSLQCNNIGFVDKAKAVANNEFGVVVFVMNGSVSNGTFLLAGDATLSSACSSAAGISKANCNCQTEAAGRGFKGTFRAWISISGSVDAICNIQGSEETNCSVDTSLGPFVFNNGGNFQILAENFSELSTTGFRSALTTSAKPVFTGTSVNGRATGSDCTGFTISGAFATAGDVSLTGTGFTSNQLRDCSAVGAGASHICMKQPK